MFLEKVYLEAIKEIRVNEILNSTENKEAAEEFLKHILVSAAKHDEKNLVSEVCSLLMKNINQTKEVLKTEFMIFYIIGTKKPNLHFTMPTTTMGCKQELIYCM